jgi:hypothetical protein
MFNTVDGLPVHALVVHAVVVLLPLAVLGTVAIAVRPGWRRPYGPLVVALAAVGTALVPVATRSGRELATHVGTPLHHQQLGDQLIWFAVPLLVLVVALVVLDRRTGAAPDKQSPQSPVSPMSPVNAVAVLALVAAVAAGVQTYRVGAAGAHAVWDGRTQQTISSH